MLIAAIIVILLYKDNVKENLNEKCTLGMWKIRQEMIWMYEELAEELKKSNNIVFFGGAGVSTESNIPDFRSESGLYNALKKYNYSPETLLSYSFFISNP